MCKIVVFTNAKNLKPLATAEAIAEILSGSQRDGFGYAYQGAAGVFGERTLKPSDFSSNYRNGGKNIPWNVSQSEKFGKIARVTGAAIFHGRTSTNEISLTNTHPLQKHDWTLIHNGVVSNKGELYAMQSTNDSEHVLHHLATGGVDKVAANLTGYYAVAAFSPDGKLHVFKDKTARLFSGYSKKLDSFIFGTSLDVLNDLCGSLKIGKVSFAPMRDDTALVFKDNALISEKSFQSRGYEYQESKHAEKSLGYGLTGGYGYNRHGSYFDRGEDVTVASDDAPEYDEETLNAFWEEVDFADASYTFYDAAGVKIDQDEWDMLTEDDQFRCKIQRGDGTYVTMPRII